MKRIETKETSKSTGASSNSDVDDSLEFEHVVVVNDDEPAECTIFPSECTDDEILTNWVTAQSGSFVTLETMR